ncbi:MAG: hypothetical protein RIS44_2774 [Pseudomonadota bacterium]|jgi:hypothetical protein
MRQTALMIATTVVGLVAASQAQAQNVLRGASTTPYWPQWQSRLALTPGSASLDGNARLFGASVLGDYYFYRHSLSSASSLSGGFRATSGLLLGNAVPRQLFGPGLGLSSERSLGLSRNHAGAESLLWTNDAYDGTGSYLGLGYSLLSLQGGWSVSADLGLATTHRSSSLRGRSLGLGNQRSADNPRDLQLTPLLHLGLTYSF